MAKETVYWTTRNGTKIDIDKMDENHLRNTLKMIVRNITNKKREPAFQLNGDMAEHFNETYMAHQDDDRFDEASEIDIY